MRRIPLSAAVPLRPYQGRAAENALALLGEHRTVLGVMATGLGKTRTAKAIVRSFAEASLPILWLVDTDDLVWQAVEALQEAPGGIDVDVDKAERKAEVWSPIVVASVQTIRNLKRLDRYDRDWFKLIVADEAHRSMADGWDRVFEYFSSAQIIGLTATPQRMDRKTLDTRYDKVAFDIDIREAIDQGWLVPLRQHFVTVEGLDYSRIRQEAMRLQKGQMEAALLNAEMIEKMAIPLRDQIQDRSTLVFTCSVDHAYAFAAFLRKIGVTAETIEGSQKRCPHKRRRELIEAYKKGEIQVLANCATLTTGFDAPITSGVAYARPMCSDGLYVQCAGRGTRPMNPKELNDLMNQPAILRRQAIASSVKPDCLLVDFLGNSGHLTLVRAARALDPKLDDETVELVEQVVAEQPQLTMNEALELAEQMREAFLLEVAKRDEFAEHKYRVTEVDPFDGSRCKQVFDMLGIARKKGRRTPPTANQISALEKNRVPDAHLLTRLEATDLLSEIGRRKHEELASFHEIDLLVRFGQLPRDKLRNLPAARARKGIRELEANNWKRPESWDSVKTADA